MTTYSMRAKTTLRSSATCAPVPRHAGMRSKTFPHPLRFSEDFGEFARTGASAMFFLGAGEDVPDLHNPDYDFPDALLDTGVTLLHTTICRLLGQNVD